VYHNVIGLNILELAPGREGSSDPGLREVPDVHVYTK